MSAAVVAAAGIALLNRHHGVSLTEARTLLKLLEATRETAVKPP